MRNVDTRKLCRQPKLKSLQRNLHEIGDTNPKFAVYEGLAALEALSLLAAA